MPDPSRRGNGRGRVVVDAGLARAYEDANVVVTGAHGYIGSAMTEALQQTRARILLVSRRPRATIKGTTTLVADVRSEAAWDHICRSADIVFHLAGNTSARAAAADPAASLSSTVTPVAHLTAVAKRSARRPRVVYASTATVYGMTEHLPVDEDTKPNPVTTYDQHKFSAETLLAQAASGGILEAVSLRLPNVYGPSAASSSAPDRGILNSIARLALSGSDLPVFGGGRQLRDYVYIDDAVRAFLMAGVRTKASGQSFNLGSGQGTTVRAAFQLIAERSARLTGHQSHLRDVPWPPDAHPIESRNFVADFSRYARACGWAPSVPLGDGIDLLVSSLAAPA